MLTCKNQEYLKGKEDSELDLVYGFVGKVVFDWATYFFLQYMLEVSFV